MFQGPRGMLVCLMFVAAFAFLEGNNGKNCICLRPLSHQVHIKTIL